MRTWLTQRFGLSVPVVGAPMAGVADGRLAAAISTAGGLGMFGVSPSVSPEWIAQQVAEAGADGAAYGIGLMAWTLPNVPAHLDAVIAAAPALVSVSYGAYAGYVAPLHAAGIAVATQVGTTAEAREAERAGVDVIVARGGEAGGHGRNDVATLPLLQAVLDAVRTPVLAAGGIASARGLAAVLAAGAAGAWVGTAFLACTEAAGSPAARRRLLDADETSTAYGRVFDVAQRLDWPPEYGGRAVRNALFVPRQGREDERAADEDAQAELRDARRDQDFERAYIYAGQTVGAVRRERPAAEVVAEFASADDLLRGVSGIVDDR
jgi:nitronate monooxygenase